MAAVTQRIDNYLGGVSRQSDDKKLPGQVRECLNGYPDPTFGLTKRPGFKWISNLGTGTTYDNCKWFYISRDDDERYIGCITPASGGSTGDIDVWNAVTGVACTVDYDYGSWKASTAYAVGDIVTNDSGKVYTCDRAGTSASSGNGPTGTGADINDPDVNGARWDYTSAGSLAKTYLTGARTNYNILTVQDTSIITNNLITVNATTAPSYTANTKATLSLFGAVAGGTDNYSVTITPAGGSASTATYNSSSGDSYDDVLTGIRDAIKALNISGLTTNTSVKKLDTTIELNRAPSGTPTAFTITAKGGLDNSKLTAIQEQVDNVSQLPIQSKHDRVIKVINTSSVNDTYWSKFVADNGTEGTGFWQETVDPTVSTGVLQGTMPHELINSAVNRFVFKRITWKNRLVGDNTTNSHPSFVGKKLTHGFFHNNRLGFLADNNIVLSQTKDYYNFYFTSAQTITDADPVDLNTSSIKPASLHAVLPTTQGLVLFSKNQQFLMMSTDGILTPSSTSIRTISNYEVDSNIEPVDTGTTINFISKTPSYTRIFGMVTRGQDENPQVLDIGRVVNEWVPATVDTFTASPQNQFIAMSSQDDRKVYFYRTYSDGEKNLVEAWFNWELMGDVQTIAVDSDDMYSVTKQGSQFTLSKASLSQSPDDAIIVNNNNQKINPCVDLYATASSVVWDSTNKFSKCYIPWANVTTLTPVIVIKGTTATGQFIESGFTTTPTIASDGSGTYFKVPKKNLTSVATDVVVGWKYDLDVILPKTYVRTDDANTKTDFTSTLTIARMKFAVGLSGVMSFKLKSTGVRQGEKTYTGDGSTTVYNWTTSDLDYIDKDQIKVRLDGVESTAFTVTGDTQITFSSAPANNVKILIYLDEWYNLNPTQIANTYLANDIALSEQSVFSIPIHQKNTNFQLRIFNDSPFPVSLNSMMWEGNYSPRFYRRI